MLCLVSSTAPCAEGPVVFMLRSTIMRQLLTISSVTIFDHSSALLWAPNPKHKYHFLADGVICTLFSHPTLTQHPSFKPTRPPPLPNPSALLHRQRFLRSRRVEAAPSVFSG